MTNRIRTIEKELAALWEEGTDLSETVVVTHPIFPIREMTLETPFASIDVVFDNWCPPNKILIATREQIQEAYEMAEMSFNVGVPGDRPCPAG